MFLPDNKFVHIFLKYVIPMGKTEKWKREFLYFCLLFIL